MLSATATKEQEPLVLEVQKPIVAATDFSPESATAFAYAARLARAEGRKLHIVFVRNVLPREIAEVGDVDDQTLRRRISNLAAECSLEPESTETHITRGNPEREIVRIAVQMQASYIVVGTHGKRGFDRILLGSVAESVLRLSDIPVIVVGPGASANEALNVPWRHILLACDLETPVSEAADLAGELAVENAAQLTVFYLQPEGIRHLPDEQFDALASILSAESPMELKPQCLMRGGGLVMQIANMAEDSNADLLVLSASRVDRLMPRLHRGKIAEILRAAPCPILVLRRKGRPAAAEASVLN